MGLALLLKLVADASAVEVGRGDLGPLVDTVEESESHATVHVGLDVAVEEESTSSLDMVTQSDPG